MRLPTGRNLQSLCDPSGVSSVLSKAISGVLCPCSFRRQEDRRTVRHFANETKLSVNALRNVIHFPRGSSIAPPRTTSVFGCIYFDRPPQFSVENQVTKRVAIIPSQNF